MSDSHPVSEAIPAPRLSVVIPTLDERHTIPLLLEDLRALPMAYEVIVADGGSTDGTREAAARAGAKVVHCRPSRGGQLATGAAHAGAPVLCFLHADVRLDADAVRTLIGVVNQPAPAPAVFRLRIGASGLVYRLIELMANQVRTRLLRLPYGDQGLVVTRADYDAAGGYRDIPLMEDVELVRALRGVRGIRVLPASLTVSARRWQDDGPWRRTFRNWALMLAYSLGATPEGLARHYAREVERR